MFSLFRLPLGAFRPNDLMYVYEQDGRIAGLVRVERETVRDEWTIVELDAVGMANAGDIRYRLVQQLLREGAKRGAARFHVACADADGNVELLMQAGFMRYGEERVLFRPGGAAAARRRGPTKRAAAAGIRPTTPLDALAAVPAVRVGDAAARSRASRRSGSPTGSARARTGGCRARASTPILRFADVEGVRPGAPDGGRDGTELDGFVQVGVAKEDQPHYLKVIARPEADVVRPRRLRARGDRRAHDARTATIATTTASSPPCEPTNHRSTGDWRTPASIRSPASRC